MYFISNIFWFNCCIRSTITFLTAAALGAAVGMSGGSIGITTAHELIHRQNKYMRGIGVLLLIVCCYGHFRIEHIYGHHRNVATKEDPATARRGENFYFYFIRCVINSVISSWKIEKNILDKKNIKILAFEIECYIILYWNFYFC